MSRIPGFNNLGGTPNFAEFLAANNNSNQNNRTNSASNSRRTSLANNNNQNLSVLQQQQQNGSQTPEVSHIQIHQHSNHHLHLQSSSTATGRDGVTMTNPHHIGIPGLSNMRTSTSMSNNNNNNNNTTTSVAGSGGTSFHSLHQNQHQVQNNNNNNQTGGEIMRAQAWAVTSRLGPGRSNKLWVVMRPGRLSLYSSPSGHSRLLLDVQYESLRTLFFFSCPGTHEHRLPRQEFLGL